MLGSARFYSDDKSKCPDNIRFEGQEKYTKMVMFWVSMSPRGMSEPVFYRSGSPSVDSQSSISTNVYKKACSRSSKSIMQTQTTVSGLI